MEPDLVEKKVKPVYILSKLSFIILICLIIYLALTFLAYLGLQLQLTLDFAFGFIGLFIYLAAYIILLNTDGVKRKNAVGIYCIILFIYLIYGISRNIITAMNNDNIEILQVSSKVLIALLCIMLFLNIKSKIKRQLAIRNGMLTVFIFCVAAEVFYCILKYQGDFVVNIIAVVSLFPVVLLAFIAYRSFDDVFYSHFIEENPKYFITPKKPVDRDKRRVITMIAAGAVIIILLVLFRN